MNTKTAIEETIIKLCGWVNLRAEQGAIPNEANIMPEVVKGIAELQRSINLTGGVENAHLPLGDHIVGDYKLPAKNVYGCGLKGETV